MGECNFGVGPLYSLFKKIYSILLRTMMGQKFDLFYLSPFACVPGYRPEPVASSSPRELALLASFPQLSERQEKAGKGAQGDREHYCELQSRRKLSELLP